MWLKKPYSCIGSKGEAQMKKKILCLLLAALLLVGCTPAQPGQQEQPPEQQTENTTKEQYIPEATASEDEAYTEPPTEPPVQVVMPEYELTYAGYMKEYIVWEESQEKGGLCFYVKLSGGNVPLFTLLLNQAQGELVVMKVNAEGEKIPISFVMEQMPEDLSEEDKQLFATAQETVNDIIGSLTLK
jgi:hypothetical protein